MQEIVRLWEVNSLHPLWQALFAVLGLAAEVPNDPPQSSKGKKSPNKSAREPLTPGGSKNTPKNLKRAANAQTPTPKRAANAQTPTPKRSKRAAAGDQGGLETPEKPRSARRRVNKCRPANFGTPADPNTVLEVPGPGPKRARKDGCSTKRGSLDPEQLTIEEMGSDEEDGIMKATVHTKYVETV